MATTVNAVCNVWKGPLILVLLQQRPAHTEMWQLEIDAAVVS
jgi:hypothetical protein